MADDKWDDALQLSGLPHYITFIIHKFTEIVIGHSDKRYKHLVKCTYVFSTWVDRQTSVSQMQRLTLANKALIQSTNTQVSITL